MLNFLAVFTWNLECCIQFLFHQVVSQKYQLSLVPRPEEEEKRPGFSRSHMCLIVVKLPPPHTIDILQYARDARIDIKRNTVRRFMIAKYDIQETHSLYSFSGQFEAINRQCELLWSRLMRRRGSLPAKPSQEVPWASITFPSALST